MGAQATRPAGRRRRCHPAADHRPRPGDDQRGGLHADVRRAGHGLEHHGRLHRLHLPGARRLLRLWRLLPGPDAGPPQHRPRLRALFPGPGRRPADGAAGGGHRLDRVAHPSRHLRHRDHRLHVHAAAAGGEPGQADRRRRRARPSLRARLDRRLFQYPLLLRDAGAGGAGAGHLVVDPAFQVRARPAGDPR